MPELDPFDARLQAAVRAFADRVDTRVDAAAMAERTIGTRQTGIRAALGRSVPVPVSLLLLLALLLAMLIASLGGAPWDRRFAVVPVATASPASSDTPLRAAWPPPATDGKGPEIVSGTETIVILAQPTGQTTASQPSLHGGAAAVVTDINDPRVTGSGTWRFDREAHGAIAAESGRYHLENGDGAWDGTCRGGTWDAGTASVRGCWLTGTGAYDGYTFVFNMTRTALGSGAVEGVIYPGPPAGP
jgi:hypothetical protein